MANDWTIGVEITDIVEVIAGEDSAGTDMVMVTTESGIWNGTDVTAFATLAWTAIVTGGALAKAMYVGSGKFVAVSDNGKVYEFYFETASGPPVVTNVYDDDNSAGTAISAIAHAEARGETVFAQQNKVYVVPVGGGEVTERMDTDSVIEAGSKVFDVDYGPNGWTLLVEKADFSVATVMASADWATVDTAGFDDAVSTSPLAEVNYFEDVNGGTWMAGREDGTVVETTDLGNWKPEPAAASLWVTVGLNGTIATSTDATTWVNYQAPAGTTHDYYDLSYGKDANGGDRWYITSTNTPSEVMYSADPTAGENSWTMVDLPADSRGKTIEYSANGTVIMGQNNGNVQRTTDYGATWTSHNTPATAECYCLATDGAGFWMMGAKTGGLYKSWDDGITWARTKTNSGIIHGIEYANGTWVATADTNAIFVAQAANITSDNTRDTASWSDTWNPNTAINSLCHHTGTTWFVSGAGRDVWKSTNNAVSWTQVSDIVTVGGSTDIAYSLASDGDSTIVAASKTGNISKSTDLGVSWTSVHDSDPNRAFYSVEFNKVKPYA